MVVLLQACQVSPGLPSPRNAQICGFLPFVCVVLALLCNDQQQHFGSGAGAQVPRKRLMLF